MTPDFRQVANHLIEHRRQYRATRTTPCPVCGHTSGWCLVCPAGCLCPRSDGTGASGKFGEYGYLHLTGQLTELPPTPKPKPAPKPGDWRGMAEKAWHDGATRLHLLSEEIGVSVPSLEHLRVGWSHVYKAWTVPEYNEGHEVLGLSLRFPGGKKLFVRGGRRGLTYPKDWFERAEESGMVYVVEGASDVAASMDAGWSAIGRPSNVGGLQFLVPMVRRLPLRVEVVIVGEHDRRPHHTLNETAQRRHRDDCTGCELCWPGLHGAKTIFRGLRKATACRIEVVLPEDGKDVRSMLTAEAPA